MIWESRERTCGSKVIPAQSKVFKLTFQVSPTPNPATGGKEHSSQVCVSIMFYKHYLISRKISKSLALIYEAKEKVNWLSRKKVKGKILGHEKSTMLGDKGWLGTMASFLKNL